LKKGPDTFSLSIWGNCHGLNKGLCDLKFFVLSEARASGKPKDACNSFEEPQDGENAN